MEIQEFIEKFEEIAEEVKNSATRVGTYRVIKEKDWQKLKKEAFFGNEEDEVEVEGDDEN
jgi:hypothetical protein